MNNQNNQRPFKMYTIVDGEITKMRQFSNNESKKNELDDSLLFYKLQQKAREERIQNEIIEREKIKKEKRRK